MFCPIQVPRIGPLKRCFEQFGYRPINVPLVETFIRQSEGDPLSQFNLLMLSTANTLGWASNAPFVRPLENRLTTMMSILE